ncbi:MAG TPA: ABC transporter family substrate-binding protein [Gaiellaceae bacterium]|jgi:peptide/nickel transport system substrate-binding protein|nr:ABC transporter family substrate-binding protein [Gaiellaceae bacterium]
MRSARSERRSVRTVAALVGAGVVLLALAACGGGSTGNSGTTGATTSSPGGSTKTVSVKSGGSLTFALDEDLSGFNVLNLAQNEFVLQEILDPVWPSVFITPPNLKPTPDPNLVSSVKLTKKNPQTVVYKLNPKAKWSDGVPINADDFIYNWHAQSGSSKFTDKGGKPFEPASTSGYNQIKSVTGSHGGKTVTVVFSKPYGDWQALFSPLIPAHISEKVGFNEGWSTFGAPEQVSGGPFMIQSYKKGSDLVEVPNPHYWGPKAKLSKLIFRFILDDSQQPPAVQNGEVDMVNPALPGLDFYNATKSISGFQVSVEPGLEFQHIDFNETNPYLAKASIRHAIAWGTDRNTIAKRSAGEIDSSLTALNNRIYMPTQPEYKDMSGSFSKFNPALAKKTLQKSGMTMGSDGYFHPNFGPEKGQDFTLSISTTAGVPVRAQIEQLFQSQMKSIGVKINIQNYTADKLFGTIGPKGQFDMIEFAWVSSPFASGNQSIYCSYTNTSVCGSNWDHYADKKVDATFDKALTTVDPTQAAALYNKVDGLLWKDMATLPLFQQPQLFGWSTKFGNIFPNTSNTGIPWNATQWGVKSS